MWQLQTDAKLTIQNIQWTTLVLFWFKGENVSLRMYAIWWGAADSWHFWLVGLFILQISLSPHHWLMNTVLITQCLPHAVLAHRCKYAGSNRPVCIEIWCTSAPMMTHTKPQRAAITSRVPSVWADLTWLSVKVYERVWFIER